MAALSNNSADPPTARNIYTYTQNITLLVKDETDRGVPVAHCISAKEDTNALYVFFKELRKQLGQIVLDYVLTDDAKQVSIKK